MSCLISLLLQEQVSLCFSITTSGKASMFNKCPVCSLRTLLGTRVLITLLLFLPLSNASPFYCVAEFWLWSIRNLIPAALYAKVHTNLISASPVSRAEFIPCFFINCCQTDDYGRRPASWSPSCNGTVICIWQEKSKHFPCAEITSQLPALWADIAEEVFSFAWVLFGLIDWSLSEYSSVWFNVENLNARVKKIFCNSFLWPDCENLSRKPFTLLTFQPVVAHKSY